MLCVSVHCGVVYRVAVCCIVFAACCSVLQRVAACCSVLQRISVHWKFLAIRVWFSTLASSNQGVLQCDAVYYSVLQCVVVCCRALQ